MSAEFDPFAGYDYRAPFVEACLRRSPQAREWLYALDEAVSTQVAPRAEAVDAEGAYPEAGLSALRDIGAFGVQIPASFGGLGFGDALADLAVERVARACSSTAAVLMFHYQVVRRTLRHATSPRREEDLAAFASGTLLAASAWTEANTDPAKRHLATTISDGPHGWRVSGEKTFCTGLPSAGVVHVLADAQLPGGRTGSCFVRVDANDPGVRIPPGYPLLGLRGSGTGTLELRDVSVAEGDLIGEPGRGGPLMQDSHQVCLNPGLLALGTAAAAFETAYLMCTGALPGSAGRTSSELVRQALSQALTQVECAYLYGAQAVAGEDGPAAHVLTGKFKMAATGAAEQVTRTLLAATGSRGFVASFPLERHFRDAQAMSLMGPTNTLIATRVVDDLLRSRDNQEVCHA